MVNLDDGRPTKTKPQRKHNRTNYPEMFAKLNTTDSLTESHNHIPHTQLLVHSHTHSLTHLLVHTLIDWLIEFEKWNFDSHLFIRIWTTTTHTQTHIYTLTLCTLYVRAHKLLYTSDESLCVFGKSNTSNSNSNSINYKHSKLKTKTNRSIEHILLFVISESVSFGISMISIESKSFELIVYTNAVANKFTEEESVLIRTHYYTRTQTVCACVCAVYLFFDLIFWFGGWVV